MLMMQGWAQTVNNLMSRFEDTMDVLGTHELREGEDPKGSEPEQSEHDLIGLPGRQVTDEAHASETLSQIRAHFQSVSCPLNESPACSWGSQALLLQGQPGLGGV